MHSYALFLMFLQTSQTFGIHVFWFIVRYCVLSAPICIWYSSPGYYLVLLVLPRNVLPKCFTFAYLMCLKCFRDCCCFVRLFLFCTDMFLAAELQQALHVVYTEVLTDQLKSFTILSTTGLTTASLSILFSCYLSDCTSYFILQTLKLHKLSYFCSLLLCLLL